MSAAANGFGKILTDVGVVVASGVVATACVVYLADRPKKKQLQKTIAEDLSAIASIMAKMPPLPPPPPPRRKPPLESRGNALD